MNVGIAAEKPPPEGIVVSEAGLPAWNEHSVDQVIAQWIHSQDRADRPAPDPIGMRSCLPPREGTGYWDFFRSNEQLTVCVADAVYRTDKWVEVEGEKHFKVRLLLSGTLSRRDGCVILTGPQGHVEVNNDDQWDGYWIRAGQETRMLVLHCRADLLADVLPLDRGQAPPPFDRLFHEGRGARSQTFALSPDVIRLVGRIFAARGASPYSLRAKSIELSSLSLLCAILGEFAGRSAARPGGPRLSARDIMRIDDARGYLTENYVSPPRITDLARRMGVNQTKLKSGFKAVFGLTIYEYVVKVRMERAADRLHAGGCRVSDVSHSVGYEYPASFTAAFRRYFGTTPRVMLRRDVGAETAGPQEHAPLSLQIGRRIPEMRG